MKPWPLSRCHVGTRPIQGGVEPVYAEGWPAARYRLGRLFDALTTEPLAIGALLVIAAVVVLVAFGLAGHPIVGR